jgi:hypothetical protein
LALVLILSLTMVSAAPVSAANDNEWDTHTYFQDGEDDDWFYNSAIEILEGPGPMFKAIDGTLWLYVALDDVTDNGAVDAGERHIFTSDDNGRTWEKTDYYKDLTLAKVGNDAGTVVDMAASPTDADTMYVTDGAHVYWTENGGGKWEEVSDTTLGDVMVAVGETITGIAVNYSSNDDAHVFIGTATGTYAGSVYTINQDEYGAEWIDLEVEDGTGTKVWDIYAVGVSPDFADSDEIFALVTNADPYTAVFNNEGQVSVWGDMTADLETDTDADDDYDDPFEINGASRFVFPSDFDDEYEFFIGVTGVAWPGSVHRINDDIAYNLGEEDGDIDADIISLDLVGSFGNVQMLAGTPAAEGDAVLVSTDDGEKWDDMDKDPFGVGDTYVVMDEDFADNGTAWAAVSGANGGVAETTNSAEHFNQISMINVNIDAVEAIDFADGNMLMITMDATSTDESVWMEKSDWERVFIFDEANATLDLIAVSPESADVIYIGNSYINGEINDAQQIFRTTNNGNEWDDLGVLPGNLFSWVVIDDSTVIAGGNEEVFITENYGRRKWNDEDIDGAGNIVHLVLSPNFSSDETILAGDDNGSIAISEDMGDTWDVVDKADVLGTAANTYVAFDQGYADNMTIYAASGATVERCIIDSGDDW